MNLKPDITKIAAQVIKEGKLLIVKKFGKDIYISLGGRLEENESELECLKREIKEEIDAEILGEPKLYNKSPIEEDALVPGRSVQIVSYLVEIVGDPKPSSEIELVHWLSIDEYQSKKFKLGSVLQDYVIPKLIKDGLIY